VGAVVVTAAVVGPVSAGVEDLKTFTVDVDGTVPTAVAGQAGVWAGDADAVVSITITNTSAQQTLGSANVTLPSPPFRVVTAPADTVPGGPVLELRSLGLAPGGTVTVLAAVDVQTCGPTAPVTVTADAKQSNDYNGTGNDLTLVASGSDQSVDVVGTCRLAFVTQPASAERTRAITGTAFDPAGAPIAVEVRDAGGSDRATSSTATVSLGAVNPSAPAAVLGGVTSTAAVAGLATFAPGPTLDTSAFGFVLVASSAGLGGSGPSRAFDIVDDQTACQQNVGCSATAQNGKQVASLALGGGSTSGSLLVSVDAADTPAFECPGYPRAGLPVSQFLFTGGGDRTGTFTVSFSGGSRPLKSYEVCWAAPYQFTTKSTTPLTVQGVKPGTTDPLYVGLLPDCARRGAIAPCVSSRAFDSRTRTVTIAVFVTSDDPWRY
jgi:hypothetical protein